VDEANIEAHGAMPMGRFAMDSAFQASMLARAQRMMARDVAHPSVRLCGLEYEKMGEISRQKELHSSGLVLHFIPVFTFFCRFSIMRRGDG
jgi:beta-galactosidase/beta-glucuronidase